MFDWAGDCDRLRGSESACFTVLLKQLSLSGADQLRIAVETLLQNTGSATEGYLLLWDGWGDNSFPESVLRTRRVVVQSRE